MPSPQTIVEREWKEERVVWTLGPGFGVRGGGRRAICCIFADRRSTSACGVGGEIFSRQQHAPRPGETRGVGTGRSICDSLFVLPGDAARREAGGSVTHGRSLHVDHQEGAATVVEVAGRRRGGWGVARDCHT